MTTTSVGAFSMTGEGEIAGPVEFMESEDFGAWKSRLYAGDDRVFNEGCTRSPSVEAAVLVSLQTRYAAWKGQRDFDCARRCAR